VIYQKIRAGKIAGNCRIAAQRTTVHNSHEYATVAGTPAALVWANSAGGHGNLYHRIEFDETFVHIASIGDKKF